MNRKKELQKWIEVTGHFDHDTDGEFVFDCELPEDGQEILVTLIGGDICRDICRVDTTFGYHLESGCDWDDVFKWAPMPPAWWEENGISDPIDRQILKDDLLCGDNTEHDYCFPCKRILERIDNQPAAQPEIIRCKDCKHWDGVDTCDVIDAPVWDDDFCSLAERRSHE